MKIKKFEYIKGNARTNKPWFRPDFRLLNSWKKDFFKISGVEKYKFWICGGVLENWKTWDTDILVTGKLDSYDEIENILVTSTQLGFKYRQLIDINWNDYYAKYIDKGSCGRRGICCDHYYRNGWCNIEHCISPSEDVDAIVIASTIIKNGKMLTKGNPCPTQIGESLWKIKMKSPSRKQINRIKNGIIYKSSPVLLMPDLDFEKIVK